MTTKIFISGKNWRLSLAEVVSYLEARKISFEVQLFSKEFFAITVAETFVNSAINDLGGLIKIGEAKTNFPTQILKAAFLEKNKEAQNKLVEFLALSGFINDVGKTENKVFFGVSIYCSDKILRQFSWAIQRFVGSTIKSELSRIGRKSNFMGFSKNRGLAQLSHVEVLKKNFVENKAELLICIGKEETWVAVTLAVHNPFDFQKRDVYKPNQRKIFAIPPRLAKIMVNLSSCTPGKVLLDPFCGVGTILQEALMSRAKVVGVDANGWCVKAAGENLSWLVNEYSLEDADFRVVQGDINKLAQKVGQETVDCIVTEPDLGPALRQVPTRPYAEKIIRKLEPLYYSFIDQAYKVLKTDGRLVMVTPYIITRSGQEITMPIGEKLAALGYSRVQPFNKKTFSVSAERVDNLIAQNSLFEIDERHKIGREIHVYKK